MSLFKKKKKIPALHYSLDLHVEEAKEMGKTCFYYVLEKQEIQQAEAWAIQRRYWIELSHKNGDNLVYKISGF